ncbi:MAG TPA: ABC transporter ATP-binding protein [Acidimicrobiia bacterium]|jgi:NitT/TauT family transport system ATP-binding protein
MTATMIRTDRIGKTYGTSSGEVVALEGVTLEIETGEITSLLGSSGCGKSTFLNVLAGLIPQTTGEAEVAGRPPRPRREVGLMFQRSLLFPWRTVIENVLLPGEIMKLPTDETRQRARELLDLVGLDGWDKKYPWELSGGMQQRVALARVLLPDPDVLLLDEPFGALDEMTREALDLELTRIANLTKKTVVLVTHSVYEAVMISDRVFVFTPRPGRLAGIVSVPFGRPRDLGTSGTPAFAEKVAEVRALMAGSES